MIRHSIQSEWRLSRWGHRSLRPRLIARIVSALGALGVVVMISGCFVPPALLVAGVAAGTATASVALAVVENASTQQSSQHETTKAKRAATPKVTRTPRPTPRVTPIPRPAPRATPTPKTAPKRAPQMGYLDMRTGIQVYAAGNYQVALEVLERALQKGLLPSDRQKVMQYAASAAYMLGETEQARDILKSLCASAPNSQIDTSIFPPEFCSFARSARR